MNLFTAAMFICTCRTAAAIQGGKNHLIKMLYLTGALLFLGTVIIA